MLSERWGKHNSRSNGQCKENDHNDDNHNKEDVVNTGNNSKKKIGNGIKGGDTVTFVNTGDDSAVFVFPFLNGNTIAPVIDLLSNPQLILGAITGLNDADPELKIDII